MRITTAQGTLEVYVHSFLTSVTDGDGCSHSRTGCLRRYPVNRTTEPSLYFLPSSEIEFIITNLKQLRDKITCNLARTFLFTRCLNVGQNSKANEILTLLHTHSETGVRSAFEIFFYYTTTAVRAVFGDSPRGYLKIFYSMLDAEVHTGFGRETWGKEPLVRPKRRCENNIKMNLREVGWWALTRSIWLRTGTGSGILLTL